MLISNEFAATVLLFNTLAKEVEALGGLSMKDRCDLLRRVSEDDPPELKSLIRQAADLLDPTTDRPVLTLIEGGKDSTRPE